jgi:AcrR family transcriptional regulator
MLRDALQELLDKKPFEEISVSEICELSTVRRATFYRHFKDKNAFFEWYLQTITEQFLAEAEDANGVESLESYTRYMHRKLIEFSVENYGWLSRNIGKTALTGSLDMVMNQAAAGIAEKVSSEANRQGIVLSATPEFISMFYAGGMVHTLRWWLTNEMPISADALEEGSTDFLLRFLGFETK